MISYEWSGRRVITTVYLTVAGEPMTVRRSWRNRLFSRPWRPWKSTYTYTPQVPSPEVLLVGDTFYVHPATWSNLCERLKTDSELKISPRPGRLPLVVP